MPLPELDRMLIEDAASSPERIAAEIHRQLGAVPAPIQVRDIALALDIVEIEERALKGYEGALVTDPERDCGSILIRETSGKFRQRYSIAHELGHFLCGWHGQTDTGGFFCTRDDMQVVAGSADRRSRQEAEANSFAIELLAPPRLIAPYIRRLAELEQVVAMSDTLHISKAAAARRYVALHKQPLAVVFAGQNRFLYTCRHPDFPWLDFTKGDPLPGLPKAGVGRLSEMVEADPMTWRINTRGRELSAQILQQADGYAMALLSVDEP